MNPIIAILAILASLLLILVVVIQNSKGGGLSSTFGANNLSSMIGNRRATQDIEKVTWYLITGVMVISFVAAFFASSGNVQSEGSLGNLLNGVQTQQQQPAAPAGGQTQPALGGGGDQTPG